MKVLCRIERLEARTPKLPKRIILVWVDREGRRTKVADTHPHLGDSTVYDKDNTALWVAQSDARTPS